MEGIKGGRKKGTKEGRTEERTEGRKERRKMTWKETYFHSHFHYRHYTYIVTVPSLSVYFSENAEQEVVSSISSETPLN